MDHEVTIHFRYDARNERGPSLLSHHVPQIGAVAKVPGYPDMKVERVTMDYACKSVYVYGTCL